MPLNSISPINGRYQKYTESLSQYFSELAGMKYKIIAEGEHLIALSETKGINVLEFVHLGLTSEDASNVAYALALSESVKGEYLPALEELINKISKLAKAN